MTKRQLLSTLALGLLVCQATVISAATPTGTNLGTKILDGTFQLSAVGNYTINGITNMDIPFIGLPTSITAEEIESGITQAWIPTVLLCLNSAVAMDALTLAIVEEETFDPLSWESLLGAIADNNPTNSYSFIAPWTGNYNLTTTLTGGLGGVQNYVYITQGPFSNNIQLVSAEFSSNTQVITPIKLIGGTTYFVTTALGSGSAVFHNAGALINVSYADSANPQYLNISGSTVASSSVKISKTLVGPTTLNITAGFGAYIPYGIHAYTNVSPAQITGSPTATVSLSTVDDYNWCANLNNYYTIDRTQGNLVSGPVALDANDYSATFTRTPDDVYLIVCGGE